MNKVEEIVREVRRLAAEKPDFIYEVPADTDRCLYVNPSAECGSCIVGQAILNITPRKHKSHVYETLSYFDTKPVAMTADDAVRDLVNVSEKDEESLEWIDLVQRCQDNGLPWKLAVQRADEAVLGE